MTRRENERGESGVKTYAVELIRLGYIRGVPVEDCIVTTGSMPGKGCDAMGVDEAGKEYKAEEMLACPLLKPV